MDLFGSLWLRPNIRARFSQKYQHLIKSSVGGCILTGLFTSKVSFVGGLALASPEVGLLRAILVHSSLPRVANRWHVWFGGEIVGMGDGLVRLSAWLASSSCVAGRGTERLLGLTNTCVQVQVEQCLLAAPEPVCGGAPAAYPAVEPSRLRFFWERLDFLIICFGFPVLALLIILPLLRSNGKLKAWFPILNR